MGLIETEGVVLKSYSLSEADKIILFLTRSQGIIRGVARGARRLKSRFGGGLEPLSVVNLSYYQKEERELVSLNQIDLIKSNFESASDPLFLQKFSYLTEILLEFAPPQDPNEKLYRMARVCLETAALDKAHLESVVVYFELWLLRLAGFLPDWNKCDQCKRLLAPDEPTVLQINFHLFCRNCQKTRNNWAVTAIQRQYFLAAQKISPVEFTALTGGNNRDLREVSGILKRIISQILGREVIGEKLLVADLL